MIAIIKTKNAMPLSSLCVLVLRFIYERDKLNLDDIHRMKDSVIAWKQKLDLDYSLNRVNEEEEYILGRIGYVLKSEEEGKFDERKKLFKDKGIDWKKFHKLPGAHTELDYIKANQAYEEYKKLNPEQEGLS
ncbi:MAG: hypothetical protein WC404_00195 [Candidatus Omnitrophota bacterium]|jgi:hypothetical protein